MTISETSKIKTIKLSYLISKNVSQTLIRAHRTLARRDRPARWR